MKTFGLFLFSALALLAQQGPQNPPPQPMQPRPRQTVPPGQPMQSMQPGRPMEPGMPMQPMQPQPPDYRALRDFLNLSNSQFRRMEQARESARREAGEKERTLRPQIEEKRLALEEMLGNPNADAALVGRAMLEIRGLQRQIRQAHEAVRTAELNVLTAEQKMKFKAIQDAANLPEATRQAQRLGLVAGPPQPQPPVNRVP